MNRNFAVLADSDICNEFDDSHSDSCAADSDEVDSEVEFHLYSQLHYCSDITDFDDGYQNLAQSTEKDGVENTSKTKDETIREKPSVSDTKPELLKSEPKAKKKSFNKADVALLKDYLSDTNEDDTDFVPESWEIVDSVDETDSDDGGLDIHVSADTGHPESELNEADEDSKACWKIGDRDKKLFATESRGRYYANETSRSRCHNCNETGHKARDCPAGKKQPACYMCGNRGHIGRDCPERESQKWKSKSMECNRCRQVGHMQFECPDLWRQYHLTTEVGPIKMPKIPVKLNKNVQCYNCAKKGHFGHECDRPRFQPYAPMQKSLVHRYDKRATVELPQNLRRKQNEKELPDHRPSRTDSEKPLKRMRPKQHIIFRSPSRERKERQNHKRKERSEDSISVLDLEPTIIQHKRTKKGSEPEGHRGYFLNQQSFDRRLVASNNEDCAQWRKHEQVTERKVKFKKLSHPGHPKSTKEGDFLDRGDFTQKRKFFNGAKTDKRNQKRLKVDDRTRHRDDRGFRRHFK